MICHYAAIDSVLCKCAFERLLYIKPHPSVNTGRLLKMGCQPVSVVQLLTWWIWCRFNYLHIVLLINVVWVSMDSFNFPRSSQKLLSMPRTKMSLLEISSTPSKAFNLTARTSSFLLCRFIFQPLWCITRDIFGFLIFQSFWLCFWQECEFFSLWILAHNKSLINCVVKI